jgi:hypothetical protein
VSGSTVTLTNPGTYFVVVSATLTYDGAASYGQCGAFGTGLESAGFQGAYTLAGNGSSFDYTYSGIVTVPSSSAPLFLSFSCAAFNGTTNPAVSVVQWWYSPVAVTSG